MCSYGDGIIDLDGPFRYEVLGFRRDSNCSFVRPDAVSATAVVELLAWCRGSLVTFAEPWQDVVV